MRIIVKVKPNAKIESVERVTQATLDLGIKEGLDIYKVSVKEPPVGGRANEGAVRVLAEYFEVSRSQVTLVRGGTSKNKIFEITK